MDRAKTNKWMGRAFAVAALSAIAAITACGGSTTATAEKTRTAAKKPKRAIGGGPMSLVTAVDMIASERCAHEGSCDRLGPGRRFRDNDACRSQVLHETRTILDTKVCDTGLVETETLLECLAAIRVGGCSVDLAAACEPSSMCSP